MKNPERLNPCPFCGTHNVAIYKDPRVHEITFVTCTECGAVVSFRGKEQHIDTLQAWNARNTKQKP